MGANRDKGSDNPPVRHEFLDRRICPVGHRTDWPRRVAFQARRVALHAKPAALHARQAALRHAIGFARQPSRFTRQAGEFTRLRTSRAPCADAAHARAERTLACAEAAVTSAERTLTSPQPTFTEVNRREPPFWRLSGVRHLRARLSRKSPVGGREVVSIVSSDPAFPLRKRSPAGKMMSCDFAGPATARGPVRMS
jgi:hypothetical protein